MAGDDPITRWLDQCRGAEPVAPGVLAAGAPCLGVQLLDHVAVAKELHLNVLARHERTQVAHYADPLAHLHLAVTGPVQVRAQMGWFQRL